MTAYVDPRRRLSRLAAVQALYEIHMTGADAEVVIAAFADKRWATLPLGEGSEVIEMVPPRMGVLRGLVDGVMGNRLEIDQWLRDALDGGRDPGSIEPLLLAILRTGVYELAHRPKVPAKGAVSEYVAIADAFFDERQPAMVNAVLDRAARVLRGAEFVAG